MRLICIRFNPNNSHTVTVEALVAVLLTIIVYCDGTRCLLIQSLCLRRYALSSDTVTVPASSVSSLFYECPTPKMKTLWSFEIFIRTDQSPRRNFPEYFTVPFTVLLSLLLDYLEATAGKLSCSEYDLISLIKWVDIGCGCIARIRM